MIIFIKTLFLSVMIITNFLDPLRMYMNETISLFCKIYLITIRTLNPFLSFFPLLMKMKSIINIRKRYRESNIF